MNRGAYLGFVALLATGPATTAVAQTPVERGSYLVNTVMTCHNCHTPMGPNGPQFDKALSGGLRFNEPPFDVTGSNLTPDPETGLGKWSDADLKTALLDGVRPSGHHLAEVMRTAKEAGSLLPPKHILNAPTRLMQSEGYGDGYDYDHDAPDAFSGQDYFPDALGRKTFYDPPERGFEREIRKRLEYWAKLRRERSRA